MKNNIISEIYEKNISYLRKCNIYDFRNKLVYNLTILLFFCFGYSLIIKKRFCNIRKAFIIMLFCY